MSDFSLLCTKEYKPIIARAMSIVINTYSGQKGVFAYDKKSRLLFEFDCVLRAQEADNDSFVIFDGDNIYFKNLENDEYFSTKFSPEIDVQTFADMMRV